jgi:Tol biopolymer transport system component
VEAVENVQRLGTLLANHVQAGLPHIRADELDLGSELLTDDGEEAWKLSMVRCFPTQSKRVLPWSIWDGKRLAAISEPGIFGQISLSPDERRLAVERPDPQTATTDLWILELTTGIFSRFTFGPSNNTEPVWSSDGRELAFSSERKGKWDLYRKQLAGADEVLLFQSDSDKFVLYWLPDGKSVLFVQPDNTLNQLPLGRRKPIPLLASRFNIYEHEVSPDGNRVACGSDESGRPEVYVAVFPALSEKRRCRMVGAACRGGGTTARNYSI